MLRQAVQGISELITVPGEINVDFADVKTIMTGMGMALMGTGIAKGENRALEAAQRAISSPLLEETSIEGATRRPDQHHRRPRPHPARGGRSRPHHLRRGRPRRQHHLRHGDRRSHDRRDEGDGDRHRLRPRPPGQRIARGDADRPPPEANPPRTKRAPVESRQPRARRPAKRKPRETRAAEARAEAGARGGRNQGQRSPPGRRPRGSPARPAARQAEPRADARVADARVAEHELDESEADMPFYRKALAQRHADDPGGYGPNWSNIDDFDIPTVLRKQMD